MEFGFNKTILQQGYNRRVGLLEDIDPSSLFTGETFMKCPTIVYYYTYGVSQNKTSAQQ